MADSRTKQIQLASSTHILRSFIEPKDDIIAERNRATYPIQELILVVAGGKELRETRLKFSDVLAKSEWGDKSRRYFLTREQEYVEALKGVFGIWREITEHGYNWSEAAILRQLLDFPSGLELHVGMFIPTLMSQATEEQQDMWLSKALNMELIGTYAQTELGHGTFVRGLETTATYDAEKQEFILHSPTLTSTKWWPGGLGKTATHAVVMARLFTSGKDHGPHGFIVQLRDPATHIPLPGINIGDIGPKFGYNGVDNGYMSFDHVRLPRGAMLMRFAKVTPEGQYIPPPPANAKASYATMLYVRADIVKHAGYYLSRAVTVATRYTAVRRQTTVKAGQPELQVLDYQNCVHTLLPLVAAAYALIFMGRGMAAMYTEFEKARNRNDFSALPELHALSSCLKALCTGLTSDGIEACRRTCGGHGYSSLSALPTMYTNYVQNVTWEGDNNVLCLQTARYLVKLVASVLGGGKEAPVGSAAYLGSARTELHAKCAAAGPPCWEREDVQLAALQHVATRQAVQALELLRAAGGGKVAFEGEAWNNNTVALIRLARSHAVVLLLTTFYATIRKEHVEGALTAPTVTVLRQLAALLATSMLEERCGDLMEDGYATGEQCGWLRAAQRQLLVALRPNAVALVDSFGLTDYELNSALGRHDGDVYRALLEMAQQSPLNQTQEGPAWQSVLRPVLQRDTESKVARSRL